MSRARRCAALRSGGRWRGRRPPGRSCRRRWRRADQPNAPPVNRLVSAVLAKPSKPVSVILGKSAARAAPMSAFAARSWNSAWSTSGRRSRTYEFKPAGSSATVGPAWSIDAGRRVGSIGAPTSSCKRVDVLRDQRALLREVGLGLAQDLFGLAEVGARRDPAFEPEPRQAHAFLRAVDGLLRHQQQARIRRIVEPCVGDIGDERQPRRARARLRSRDIARAAA